MPHEEVPDVHTMALHLIDEEVLEQRTSSSSTTTPRLIDEELVEDRTSMEEHRRLLASFGGDGRSVWSKVQCGRIIEAAEALPELTATENLMYIKALDQYDYPEWFRKSMEERDGRVRDALNTLSQDHVAALCDGGN